METQKPNKSAKPETQPTQTASDGIGLAAPEVREPMWIVNDNAELGVMVDGRAYFLYKGDNIVYETGLHDDGSPILFRKVGKREFGESCITEKYYEKGWNRLPGGRYLEPCVYTPGLSDGPPNNPDYEWRPLSVLAQRKPQTQDSQQPACASSVPPKAKSGSGSLGTEIAEKWTGVGCCIHMPDGAIICVDDGVKATELRRYHNAYLSAVPAQKEDSAIARNVTPQGHVHLQETGDGFPSGASGGITRPLETEGSSRTVGPDASFRMLQQVRQWLIEEIDFPVSKEVLKSRIALLDSASSEASVSDERKGVGVEAPTTQPVVHFVRIQLCDLCLQGKGDECHTPGCALFLHNSPGHPIDPAFYELCDPLAEQPSGDSGVSDEQVAREAAEQICGIHQVAAGDYEVGVILSALTKAKQSAPASPWVREDKKELEDK